MITSPNVWGGVKELSQSDIFPGVNAGTPTNGSSGAGAGVYGPGSTCVDSVTGIEYINIGTKAAPIWVPSCGQLQATWDFAVDGGAQGVIVLAQNCVIPKNAIIVGGVIHILTTFVGATATIAIGTTAGSSATAIKAATAVATYAAGIIAVVPVWTAASAFRMTANGSINITIATANLTAGKMNIILNYLMTTD